MRLFFLLAVQLLAAAVMAQPVFEVGAAKVEITPPVGVPLNGYGDRMGRDSLSVHDPLWARALYVSDGEVSFFLVTTDLCVINRELRDRVLELAPQSVPAEHVLLTATHTHNGHGGMMRQLIYRAVSGRFIPELLEDTAQKIAAAMQQAYDARTRGAIGFATVTQKSLTVNRREEDGPIDPQIGVIRVDDSDGNPLAIVANMAAHPTSVPDEDHFAISADYPGYFYDELEKSTETPVVAMFMNGALGNQTITAPDGTSGWARTEAVGRALARRVKEAANDIDCTVLPLRVGNSEPALPDTIAQALQPSRTPLRTLEIGDLLITFVPGEPVVEIGLELRRQALARGYRAQFTVGCANDYIGYFVPRAFYHQATYECGMSFFGPGIADWYYREFGGLMTRGTAPEIEPIEETPPAKLEPLPGAQVLYLDGPGLARGFARGRALAPQLHGAFDRRLAAPIRRGELLPGDGLWTLRPPFIDLSVIALPALAVNARPTLAGLSADAFAEIEGTALGAGMPFDAVWLLQQSDALADAPDRSPYFTTPFCTMFGALGGATLNGSALVARNLDWLGEDAPLVQMVTPEDGLPQLLIGFEWSAGVYSGMNAAGVVLCAERLPDRPLSERSGPPLPMVLRDVLSAAPDLATALTQLSAMRHLRGYHVLAAGRTEEGWGMSVVEYGDTVKVRSDTAGLLLGVLPDDSEDLPDTAERYRRVSALLARWPEVSIESAKDILADQAPGATGLDRIRNEQTRHSAIFEPAARRVHVAFPQAGGAAEYSVLTLPAVDLTP